MSLSPSELEARRFVARFRKNREQPGTSLPAPDSAHALSEEALRQLEEWFLRDEGDDFGDATLGGEVLKHLEEWVITDQGDTLADPTNSRYRTEPRRTSVSHPCCRAHPLWDRDLDASDVATEPEAMMKRGCLIFGIVSVGLFIGWFVWAVGQGQEGARRAQCMSHLKWLGLVFHNYHSQHGSLPPGTIPNPHLPPERRLSWVVEIWDVTSSGLILNIDRSKGWNEPPNTSPRMLALKGVTLASGPGEYGRLGRLSG